MYFEVYITGTDKNKLTKSDEARVARTHPTHTATHTKTHNTHTQIMSCETNHKLESIYTHVTHTYNLRTIFLHTKTSLKDYLVV